MTTLINIEKKRGDTKRHTFTVYKSDGVTAEDVSTWSGFLLTIDPEKRPVSAVNNLSQLIGQLTTDGLDGKISFVPTGSIDIGGYYYDAQALDGNSEKTTFAEGKYKITQDITKA